MLLDGAVDFPLDEMDLVFFDAIVPSDHYLRNVLRVIDFERCRDLLAVCYSPDQGRPPVDPVRMLKLEFLGYQYGLSDREVIKTAQVNMAFRYFLNIGRKTPLPHHTSMTYFRKRLGPEKHQDILDDIVAQAREHGLVKDRLRLKDATHIIANIAVPSTIRLVAQTRDELLAAVRLFDAERAAAEEARAEQIHITSQDDNDEQRLVQRVKHLQDVAAWVDPLFDALPVSTEPTWQNLQQALQLAHKVLADRANEQQDSDKKSKKKDEKKDRVISVHDSDARCGWHHGYYYGFMLDLSMDADSQIIACANMLPANGDEAADATTLIEHEEQVHGNDIEGLSIDSAGFRGELLREWTDPEGLNLEVTVPPPPEPETTVFTPEEFKLDETGETLTCPAGQSTTAHYQTHENSRQFRFAQKTCAGCPLQRQCMRNPSERNGRTVLKNHYEKEYRAARAKVQTAKYKEVRRQHPAIERKISEVVRHQKGRRSRYRTQPKVLIHGLLTVLAVNVKRIVNLMAPAVRAEAAATG